MSCLGVGSGLQANTENKDSLSSVHCTLAMANWPAGKHDMAANNVFFGQQYVEVFKTARMSGFLLAHCRQPVSKKRQSMQGVRLNSMLQVFEERSCTK